ncbi:MAG TPA: NmrA family NAD(P)-binding protein [Rhodoglobus sp.]|nr:NmrA family NAD(P)-binding protein [Rhodoglobus sp.]
MTILITGGTGTLGRPTAELLTVAGRDIRVLSRTPGPGRVVGDLSTGAGLTEALTGVDTVLHLATTASGRDVAQTTLLVDACRAAGVTHLVYISIVGVDAVPYPYYRAKLACERVIESSGIPCTILRATQFHSFLRMFANLSRRLPVILNLNVPDQPIAVEEVSQRLVELVEAGPSGRVADIGGPEQLRLRDAIDLLQKAEGTHKPVWTLPLVGRTIRTFKEGRHMPGLPGYGRETFAEYVEREVRR